MANQLVDDTLGNVLGERATFVYTSNGGVTYNIVQDSSVAVAVGNVLSTDAQPAVIPLSGTRPLRCRYILVEGQTEPEKKKRIVIGSATNPLVTGAATSVTINGVLFRVTFVGSEQRRLPRVQPPA